MSCWQSLWMLVFGADAETKRRRARIKNIEAQGVTQAAIRTTKVMISQWDAEAAKEFERANAEGTLPVLLPSQIAERLHLTMDLGRFETRLTKLKTLDNNLSLTSMTSDLMEVGELTNVAIKATQRAPRMSLQRAAKIQDEIKRGVAKTDLLDENYDDFLKDEVDEHDLPTIDAKSGMTPEAIAKYTQELFASYKRNKSADTIYTVDNLELPDVPIRPTQLVDNDSRLLQSQSKEEEGS